MEKKMERTLPPGRALRFLYETIPGRIVLKPLIARPVSELAGKIMDHKVSKVLIPCFMKKNGINPADYMEEEYGCFNDCFCRRIRPELRPLDMEPTHLMSPCDGLLSVYPIKEGLVVPVKQSSYSIARLLRSRKLAEAFEGGYCMVFRLCVNHYHRYAYPDSGRKGPNHFIPGLLHTVRPIALEHGPVFTENCREFTLLKTDHFGKMIQMEVGAMLVGKISNHMQEGSFARGEEKGCFLYGGSTIILLLQKDRVILPEWMLSSAENEWEIPVKMGECLGYTTQNDFCGS